MIDRSELLVQTGPLWDKSAMMVQEGLKGGFSFRVALAHALYAVGGLRLMQLVKRPKD